MFNIAHASHVESNVVIMNEPCIVTDFASVEKNSCAQSMQQRSKRYSEDLNNAFSTIDQNPLSAQFNKFIQRFAIFLIIISHYATNVDGGASI